MSNINIALTVGIPHKYSRNWHNLKGECGGLAEFSFVEIFEVVPWAVVNILSFSGIEPHGVFNVPSPETIHRVLSLWSSQKYQGF